MLSDPGRTPDLARRIDRLPAGSVVIYRAFGHPSALAQALALRRLTRRRKLILLVGADPVLARKADADGVHLPQRLIHLAGRLTRGRPDWLVTAAVHDAAALRRAERGGVDAVLLSAVFPSHSLSAGPPLGLVRFERMAVHAKAPVIALGGLTSVKAARLRGGAACGIAGIDLFAVGPAG
jgi:thiamine-phosphate pyrophosphorylase